jgi:hypothetical protein
MNVPSHNDELAQLKRRFIRVQLLEAPAPILIALGLYGKYSRGDVVHPLLRDTDVTTGMLVVGFGIAAWGIPQIIRLLMRISAIERRVKGGASKRGGA